jgi:hypothetical protein
MKKNDPPSSSSEPHRERRNDGSEGGAGTEESTSVVTFPMAAVRKLQEKIRSLGEQEENEESSSRKLSNEDLLSMLACIFQSKIETFTEETSPLSNFAFVGYFPTVEWSTDPTMPSFCAYHNYRIGFYRVAQFTLQDAAHRQTTIVAIINNGDGDCNTGYWGGMFRCCPKTNTATATTTTTTGTIVDHVEYQPLVQIWSTGDMETTITVVHNEMTSEDDWTFQEYPDIVFPPTKPVSDDEEEDRAIAVPYFSGLSPGNCQTQLEKLMGIAVHIFMSKCSTQWHRLPVQLRKI